MFKKPLFAAIALASLAACSSGRPAGPPQGFTAQPGIDQPASLLKAARQKLNEKGCRTAAPSYRVLAGFGDGYDVAQYELAGCLLDMTDADPRETALFREEGVLWLKRSAYAGNALAQLRLAKALSGAPSASTDGVTPDPTAAFGWALIYMENPSRDLFNMAPIDTRITDHLKEALDARERSTAQKFADSFVEIDMDRFTPPPMGPLPDRAKDSSQTSSKGGPQRKRRRQ